MISTRVPVSYRHPLGLINHPDHHDLGETMIKFRFYVHTWSPITGHADRKIVLRGATMDAALQMMIKVLEAREPGVIVNAKSYEKVTV